MANRVFALGSPTTSHHCSSFFVGYLRAHDGVHASEKQYTAICYTESDKPPLLHLFCTERPWEQCAHRLVLQILSMVLHQLDVPKTEQKLEEPSTAGSTADPDVGLSGSRAQAPSRDGRKPAGVFAVLTWEHPPVASRQPVPSANPPVQYVQFLAMVLTTGALDLISAALLGTKTHPQNLSMSKRCTRICSPLTESKAENGARTSMPACSV